MMKAGTGRVDVSPRDSMFLVGYPHVERMSTGIHDPLFATALCLDDGENKTIAVAVDIAFVIAELVEDVRQRVSARTGVDPAAIMVSSTHTHSGPVTFDYVAMRGDSVVPKPDPAYMEFHTQGITDAACMAFENRVEAEVAVTTATVDGVGCNRLDPEGPRDPEAGIVVVRRADDKAVMAVQLFYSMHPTVMHEDSKLVSSDFPHYTRLHIEERFPGAHVLYHNGPCGNLSPRYHVKAQTFDEAERLGRRLGGFVVNAMESVNDDSFSVPKTVGAQQASVRIIPRRFASVEEAEADLERARAEYERLKRENAGHGPVRTAECVVFGAEEVVTMAQAQADGTVAKVQEEYANAEVQVLRVDDLAIVGLPTECFVEYALDIKHRSPVRAFVVSMANGELQGYITTPGSTGYEANLSMFKPESGGLLVDAAIKMIG